MVRFFVFVQSYLGGGTFRLFANRKPSGTGLNLSLFSGQRFRFP